MKNTCSKNPVNDPANTAHLDFESISPAGVEFPSEMQRCLSSEDGRELWQLTAAEQRSYPLYYFTRTVTADGRFMVFHREREGWVNLFRLELANGRILQLTAGRTLDAGWAIWCEWHLRGIYNHISALNQVTNEVIFFDGDSIHGTNVETLQTRVISALPPGRRPIGQTSCSPDGTRFAYLHVDRARFERGLRHLEARINAKAGLSGFNWQFEMGGTEVAELDLVSGRTSTRWRFGHHVHHVIYCSNNTVILNHPKEHMGMMVLDLERNELWSPHSPDRPGTIGQACHQVVTDGGVFYEAYATGRNDNIQLAIGKLAPDLRSFEEYTIPGIEGWHTGFDPAGQFIFLDTALMDENHRHVIAAVQHLRGPEKPRLHILHTLRAPFPIHGQRNHAHPFLGPDRTWLYFTDHDSSGVTQIYRLWVGDLVNNPTYCW